MLTHVAERHRLELAAVLFRTLLGAIAALSFLMASLGAFAQEATAWRGCAERAGVPLRRLASPTPGGTAQGSEGIVRWSAQSSVIRKAA